MEQKWNAAFDLVRMQQAIGMRRLVRFGVIMGVALAGQILVTLSLGTVPWIQQHVVALVFIELVWWPPFFCILYFSFTGVVKLVRLALRSQELLEKQFAQLSYEFENRLAIYEQRLQEKERQVKRLSRPMQEKMPIVHLEPLPRSEH
jgi:hypothetical protein